MQAMLLIYGSEKEWQTLALAELEHEMGAYMAFTQALIEAGKFVSGSELQPAPTVRSVMVRGGGATIADGPYVDTKEQLGGYYLIEVASLDEAVDWAAKCPGARHGAVEVRPVVERG
jgi:hypothetical protein